MERGKTGLGLGIAALVLIAAAPLAVNAARNQPPPPPYQAAPALDPVAIQALRGMGAYLRQIPSFELHTKASLETTLEDTDLKINLGYEGTYRVRRPNAFFVELRSDRQVREYYYDGKSFTVNVPRQGYFSTVPAKPTLRETVDDIYTDYGISLPLADFFYWADDPTTEGITSAVRLGYAKIGGVEADQFAYRGEDLDWQIWIARGKAPLPLKIVITRRSEPARPSYSADLTWNTAPRFTAATFAFKRDAKASAIQMAQLSPEGN